jgi:hypothetical protein
MNYSSSSLNLGLIKLIPASAAAIPKPSTAAEDDSSPVFGRTAVLGTRGSTGLFGAGAGAGAGVGAGGTGVGGTSAFL